MRILDDFYKIIQENNYKVTDQRKAILKMFLDNKDKHVTVDEIHQYIIKDHPKVGLATVYRNVKLLGDLKILNQLKLNDGFTRYELVLNKEENVHHHLVCESCGAILEVKEDLMNSIEDLLDHNYGFLVSNHQAKFFGLCKNCRRKNALT